MGADEGFQRETKLRTAGGLTVRDITDEVREAFARAASARASAASTRRTRRARCASTSSSRLPRGLRAAAQRLVPTEHYYAHDDWDRRTENICPEDMESATGTRTAWRCCSARPASRPGARRRALLGTWQRVLFLELDRERDRRWLVQVVGE